MFDKPLYIPIKIESIAQAENAPEGTVAFGYMPWDKDREFLKSEVKGPRDWSGEYPDYTTSEEDMVGWTAIVATTEKSFLASFADWLEQGTPNAWNYEHPCSPGVRWDPTTEEQKVIDAVDIIRDAIGWKENLG